MAEPLWKSHYEMSATQCSHKYWSGGCQKSAKGLLCEIGLRTRTYHVLSGSVMSVWGTVESVINSSGLQKTMQLIRLKTEDQKRIVGCLIPNNVVGNIATHLSRLQNGEPVSGAPQRGQIIRASTPSTASGFQQRPQQQQQQQQQRPQQQQQQQQRPQQQHAASPQMLQMHQAQRRTASPTLRVPPSASTTKDDKDAASVSDDSDDDDDPDDAELLGLIGSGKKTLDLFM